MIIDALVLHNIGIFNGTHRLELTCDKEKNIILVGGLNGRGKTTILESILFAFYGKRVCNLTDGKWNFKQYLDRLGNNLAESDENYVELMFRIDEDEEEQSYRIKREWKNGNIKVLNRVWKNGLEDKLLASNWDMFVEEILPIAVAPFFFFDGEKISELASADNDLSMISSIKNLLGLNILEQTIRDLKVIIKNNQKNIEVSNYEDELFCLQSQIMDIKQEIDRLEMEKSDSIESINKKNNRLNELDDEFSASGGNLFEQRAELRQRKQQIEMEIQIQYEKLLGMASGDMPLYLVKNLLEQIAEKTELEKRERDEEAILKRLPELFNEYKKTDKNVNLDMDRFLEYIKKGKKHIEYNYNLTDESYIRLKTIKDCENNRIDDLKNAMDAIQRLRNELDEINNQLEIYLYDAAIQKIYLEIKELTAEIAVLQESLKKIGLYLDEKKSQISRLENEEQKLLDKAASEMDEVDDTKRIIEYARKELIILDIYRNRLQEQKAGRLSETITDCFKTIISKKNLITRIELDNQMLKFSYYDGQEKQILKDLLSAGEKQLLVIAILWGLGICSDKQLPVVIDTPLGRLDSYHREALIKNYFPKASKQMIILSTDQEITNMDYETLKEHICREYTLIYDDEIKSSRIMAGYFGDTK